MNRLKTTFNGKTLCVFANIDKDISVHLANIDTSVNRIYTTKPAYDLISTNLFKENHVVDVFDEDIPTDNQGYRKFDTIVLFNPEELNTIIRMCNREISFC